jgi:pilus assembly protein CpaB
VSRRRRAFVLGGLALALGGVAASDVGRREAAVRRQLGPTVGVVVAREPLDAGSRLTPRQVGVRLVPARYVPAATFTRPAEIAGLRTTVRVPAGADLIAGMVDDGTGPEAGAPVKDGERVAEIVAAGSPQLVRPGVRVDVIVTRGGTSGDGRSELALEDVEVLAASPAGEDQRAGEGGSRVAASLRVTVRQAVFLAAAQSFAREIRLLPRAPGDDHRGRAGLAVDSGLKD